MKLSLSQFSTLFYRLKKTYSEPHSVFCLLYYCRAQRHSALHFISIRESSYTPLSAKLNQTYTYMYINVRKKSVTSETSVRREMLFRSHCRMKFINPT